MTTDRTAALAANGKDLAAAIRYALDAGAFDHETGLRMIQQTWLDQKFAPILAALESSRPAQDIVAEMREKVEGLARYHEQGYSSEARIDSWIKIEIHPEGEYLKREDVLAILSPTKNTAPTEAEES